MITKAQIIRLASLDGVPAKTVERDYVLAHVVAAIAESNEDKGSMLVFKGGSALRLCHVEGYRYSADLDFSVVGFPRHSPPTPWFSRITHSHIGTGPTLVFTQFRHVYL